MSKKELGYDYVAHELTNIIDIDKIVIMNYNEVTSEFEYAGERHNFWELVYVDEGVLQIETDSTVFTLSKGECALHRPNEYHMYKTDGCCKVGFFCNLFYLYICSYAASQGQKIRAVTKAQAFYTKYNQRSNKRI